MSNMIKAGVLALALTGFAIGGIAPAAAASYRTSPAPGVHVTVHTGHNSAWWRHHHRHKVKVCRVHWRHHHKVRVCTIQWR